MQVFFSFFASRASLSDILSVRQMLAFFLMLFFTTSKRIININYKYHAKR